MAFPLVVSAAIAVGPVRPVTPLVAGAAAGRQDQACIASSGSETLVAWKDERYGRAGVYVAPLDADGKVVPGKQRWLTDEALAVAFAWTGQSYAVVWLSSSLTIHAMSIDGELRTLSPARVIRRGGTLSNLAWSDGRGAVMAGRGLLILDRALNVVASDDDVLPGIGPFQSARVTANGDSFVVFAEVTPEQSIIYARRYSTAGRALDAAPVQVAQTGRIGEDWDVAYGGDRFALVVTETDPEVCTVRRYIVDPASLQARALPTTPGGRTSGAHVDWVGDRFVALWLQLADTLDRYTLRMLPFTEDEDFSVVVGPEGRGIARHPEEVWNGTKLIVAYTNEPQEAPARDILVETADWRSGSATRTTASMSMQWQSIPSAAPAGNTALVAWLEGDPRTDVLRVATTRANAAGTVNPVVYLAEKALPRPPLVVDTGSMYLVFWLEHAESGIPSIAMQRLSRNGSPLDAAPTVLASGFGFTAAWNGTHVVVVWITPFGQTRAMRLAANGERVDAATIAVHTRGGALPKIASNGTDFLLVWTEGGGDFPGPDLRDIYAARITAAGVAEAPFPVAIGRGDQLLAAIASDGRDYMVAYADLSDVTGDAIVTRKVLRDGSLAGSGANARGRLVAEAAERPVALAIARTGSGYFVAWEESSPEFTSELRIAAIDEDGVVTESPATVAESEIDGMSPFVAAAGGRTGYLLFSVLEHDPVYGSSMRLMIRELGTPLPPKQRAVRH